MPEVSPARRTAFRILLSIERGHGHADDLLRSDAIDALSAPDRHLATSLVFGVLRWQLLLDHQIRSRLARPGAKLDAEVLIALRLGAFQILFLDRVPARAAIHESVELIKQAGHRFASGMANAVLRKLADAPRHDLSDDASLMAHPSWMVERWTAQYGSEAARAICRHGQQQPALSIRMGSAAVEDEAAQAGMELAPGELLTCSHTVVSGDPTAATAFREGRARIQDEGSQLIAELASANLIENRGKILDACAAPGGKTLILVERHPQAHIVACEASPRRFAQLRERLAPHTAQVEFRFTDASGIQEEENFDLALVDVPCSGTGTLGRNPEIRYRLHADDLARHAERQSSILRAAIRVVRPGGRVVYSTCSLEPEENEQVVAAVLAEAHNMHRLSLASTITELNSRGVLVKNRDEQLRACLTAEGALRLLPGRLRTDGFFIALLEKSA